VVPGITTKRWLLIRRVILEHFVDACDPFGNLACEGIQRHALGEDSAEVVVTDVFVRSSRTNFGRQQPARPFAACQCPMPGGLVSVPRL
jgi:hypothetical protein